MGAFRRLGLASLALGGLAAHGDPTPVLPFVVPIAAALGWKFWKWAAEPEQPANRAPTRRETCSWLMRHLARQGLGHLAQRVDRAYRRAYEAEDALRTPRAPRRPRELEARLDAFDTSANNLVVCVQYKGTVEDALRDLERIAMSLDRAMHA